MLPYRDSRLTIVVLTIFFIIAVIYALFEARGQLMGPTISVDTHVSAVHDPLLIVEGSADRISSLTMNGNQIQVTEEGSFREPYLLAEGYNRIVLEAKDSYGRSTSRTLEIMYTPDDGSTIPSNPYAPSPASSSPPAKVPSGSPTPVASTTASSTVQVAPAQ